MGSGIILEMIFKLLESPSQAQDEAIFLAIESVTVE
jgi:hypothetical protein